jgi:coenzyme F420-reducing hydrogenase alpha subunit
MTVIRVDHLARVEGHGGITVEIENGAVRRVEFNIFEGIRLLETLVGGAIVPMSHPSFHASAPSVPSLTRSPR